MCIKLKMLLDILIFEQFVAEIGNVSSGCVYSGRKRRDSVENGLDESAVIGSA